MRDLKNGNKLLGFSAFHQIGSSDVYGEFKSQHIANYVREKNPLDKEAFKRATSVYLIDRVIPMLPKKLSNGICSLNQGCDRLALSCIMDIDNKGNVVGHRICETLINVNRRMTYTNVNG